MKKEIDLETGLEFSYFTDFGKEVDYCQYWQGEYIEAELDLEKVKQLHYFLGDFIKLHDNKTGALED